MLGTYSVLSGSSTDTCSTSKFRHLPSEALIHIFISGHSKIIFTIITLGAQAADVSVVSALFMRSSTFTTINVFWASVIVFFTYFYKVLWIGIRPVDAHLVSEIDWQIVIIKDIEP